MARTNARKHQERLGTTQNVDRLTRRSYPSVTLLLPSAAHEVLDVFSEMKCFMTVVLHPKQFHCN